jgi:multicomponent Na+:H+ antiporter subunit E
LWNILLSFIWGMASGVFTVPNLIFGFLVGYVILHYSQRFLGPSMYFTKMRQVVFFIARYIWELFLANFRVAYDVLIPGALPKKRKMRAGSPLVRPTLNRTGPPQYASGNIRAPLSDSAYICPGVVAIPLDAKTDIEITVLACLMTLTPGSVSLDLSQDRRTLFVHAMYIDNHDVEAYRRSVKEGLERRVLELLR